MEGESARFIFQGSEIVLRVGKDALKGIAQIIALIKALIQKKRLIGDVKISTLLQKGDQLSVAKIPKEYLKQFQKTAKKYGLQYTHIEVKNENYVHIMISTKQIEQFNSVIEHCGILKDDVSRRDFTVEDVRENIDKKFEHAEKETQKGDDVKEKARDAKENMKEDAEKTADDFKENVNEGAEKTANDFKENIKEATDRMQR